MTDHPDDTLLDDDVEEHDFNFDIEKEEALLADNEFDAFIEDHPKEKSLDPESKETNELEHLDQEEDVLDIGIAEEDIVENELISVSNTLDKLGNFEPEDENILDGDPTPAIEADTKKCFELDQVSNTTDPEKDGDDENTLATGADIEKNIVSDDEKHLPSEQDEEASAKPTVISLKKPDKKSYDSLPDLAKVIELVQPHGLSRHRKHGRTLQQFTKKNRPSDITKVNKRDDCHERNDNKCDDNFYRGSRSDSRSNDGLKRSYSNGSDDASVEIVNRSQRVTEMHTSHNFVSEYKNFSSQSFLPRPEMHAERPIVATVQITQERYQIAGDFQIIRPSLDNSCHSLIRPFEPNRLFHSRGALPPPPSPSSAPHQMHRPPSQFPSNGFPGIRPLMPPPNVDNYNRPALHSPRAPQPMPRRPLHPPSGAGILPQPMRQRFPPHGGPPVQHSFPPPFMGPNGPPPAPSTYHHNYQPTRPQFGLNPAPSPPQNFSRPPPFSQPPPPLGSSNGPYYSGNPSHMQDAGLSAPNSGYQNRPPPPTNSPGHFPRMSNEGSHSVVFQHSSQRVIRMPPFPGNAIDSNSQCVMSNTGNVGPPPSGDYYVKESITTTSSTYLPPPTINQPPPPGVPSYQSAPSSSYAGDASRLGNNQVEYCRSTRDDYYANQFSDEYSRRAKSNYPFRSEAAPLDRDLVSHDLKRSSLSSMDDNVSPKRYRSNYSNSKPNDDADDEEMEYRKKVEDQKKMREKFVQMKEEQRLKNQMQNFIQNNIKGVLQRREQLLRKNENDSSAATRSVNVKAKDDGYRPEESNRNRNLSSIGNVNDKGTAKISSPRKQSDHKNPPNNTRNWCPTDDSRTPPTVAQRLQNSDVFVAKEVTQRMKTDDEKSETKNTTKQLHKVVKIKYKDGTVALKSFPVARPTKRSISSNEKPNSIESLNVTIRDDDDDSANPNRRRMIVSKQLSSSSAENNGASSRNENIIVESVRKGVTQSGVPLAQRFSNLKSTQKNENDEDSSVSMGMKSKNRLVISPEEKMRTAWIKNISSNTKPGLIQKIAGTCGTITRMRWITGNGQYNEAKVTFSKVEEANKFIHNYHRKTIDASLIFVTSMTLDGK